MQQTDQRSPIAAVGIVCVRGDDTLLVKRAKPPLQGRWSIPGGRIEWGERARDAALRELEEETGCRAELVGLIDVVDALLSSRAADDSPAITGHYILIDYAARWVSGEPRAGDDAAEARFFTPDQFASLGLWAETARVIAAGHRLVRGER
jgi:8-oxo-dGTP diphosphatase